MPELTPTMNLGEAQEPATRRSRRLVEQHGRQVPLREPQQEEARQPQQESGLPSLLAPRHESPMLPDDAPSRSGRTAPSPTARNETNDRVPGERRDPNEQ